MECTICNHTWVAVYPLEAKKLECPNCGYMNKAPESDGYFVLFMGNIHLPFGGAHDMRGVFNSLEAAKDAAEKLLETDEFMRNGKEYVFAHVYDTANAVIIELW